MSYICNKLKRIIIKIPDINKNELNFEKIWLLFQSTDKKFQDSERLLTEMFQETDKKFNEIHKELSGIGKSNGQIAEDFFYLALDKSMKILDKDLEYIERNTFRGECNNICS